MLYADVVLNLYYVLMNAYGWYYWLYGGRQLREAEDELRPQRLERRTLPTRSQWLVVSSWGSI